MIKHTREMLQNFICRLLLFFLPTLKIVLLLLAPGAVERCGWLEVEEVLVVTTAHLWINSLS